MMRIEGNVSKNKGNVLENEGGVHVVGVFLIELIVQLVRLIVG